MSTNSTKSSTTSSSEDDTNELRRGPWTVEEDTLLINYITRNGEGRWNLLAKRSGLRRTGKSCRLRWLNYLKPDVKRGNLSPEEQLLILDLHSKWGNRWSKIAQYLPGRTDNEIKNYWRTRVQKQAKHLKIDTESAAFRDIIRRFWMPRLLQKMEGGTSSLSAMQFVQNPTAPMPLDTASQQSYSPAIAQTSSSPPPPPPPPQKEQSGHGNLDMSRSNTNEQRSDSDQSMNMSHISQLYPISPFQPMAMACLTDYNTFVEGCSYGGDRNGYDIVGFNQTNFSAEPVLENPMGGCHVAGGNWAENDSLASMWNMDEFWQYRS